jgi:hypothetical protein
MLVSSKKDTPVKGVKKKNMLGPRSVCDSERDRRQNKDPLEEENLD